MRREERQVSDEALLKGILNSCKVCRLAMIDAGKPYLVPLNFGYSLNAGMLTLYFHCASAGRKLTALRSAPEVCFEMDTEHQLRTAEVPCQFSFGYSSIIGTGKAVFLEDAVEKAAALTKIMAHQTGGNGFPVSAEMAGAVTVFQVESTDFTGKANR